VTSSVDGQGVVTHLIPVSLVAQTGRYSLVHISGLGLVHWVIDLVCGTGFLVLIGSAVEHDQQKIIKLDRTRSFDVFFIADELYVPLFIPSIESDPIDLLNSSFDLFCINDDVYVFTQRSRAAERAFCAPAGLAC